MTINIAEQIKGMCIAELGAMNQSVMEYMKHWEERALKAEERLKVAKAINQRQLAHIAYLMVRLKAAEEMEKALAMRFDDDGRCFVCGFNVGGCAKTCEASSAIAAWQKAKESK